MAKVQSPYPFFVDIDGGPLEAGFIYIGQPGLDPEVSPVTVYLDKELTSPLAQPIRTLAGLPSIAGTPTQLFVAENDFSVVVRNKNGTLVRSALEATGEFFIAANLAFATVADMVAGTSLNGGDVDFSFFEGQDVTTVWENSAAKSGGGDFTIWSVAAYRLEIGDPAWVPDAQTAFYVGGTAYAALRKAKKEFVNFSDYLPDSADGSYLADVEWAAAVAYCSAAGVDSIYIPPSVSFKLSTFEMSKNTLNNLTVWSDNPSPYNDAGRPLIKTDDTRLFNVGIDDGNPDSTGFTRSITLKNLQLATDNTLSDVAVNVVNTTHFRMLGCRVYGFAEGVARSDGGNVFFDIHDTEGFGYTGRNAGTGQGRGIVMGAKYWGVFVLRSERCHFFQYKYGVGLGKGRAVSFTDLTCENLQHSVYELPNRADELYSLTITRGYSELVPQYVVHSDSFLGLIYKYNIYGYEGHECPGFNPPAFSNLSRTRVLNYNSSGVILSSPILDAQLGLTTDGRYLTTDEFDPSTTVAPRSDPYYDEQYQFRRYYESNESLGLAGTFNVLDGTAPYGWTYINGVWAEVGAPTKSGNALRCTTGGGFDKASTVVAKPAAPTRFAFAVTHNGDIVVKVDGVVVFSYVGSVWKTDVFNVTVAGTASTFEIRVGPVSGAGDPIEIAELRAWEITSSDGTEVGWTSGLTPDAIRSSLSEGAY